MRAPSLVLTASLCLMTTTMTQSSSAQTPPPPPSASGSAAVEPADDDTAPDATAPDAKAAKPTDKLETPLPTTPEDPAEQPSSSNPVEEAEKPVPPPSPLVCPKGATCMPDAELVALLLRYRQALEQSPDDDYAKARMWLEKMAKARDPRVVPVLLRASRLSHPQLRRAGLTALTAFADHDDARARLMETLRPDAPLADARTALPGILLAQPEAIPCPAAATCVDDALLLTALVQVSGGNSAKTAAEGLRALGTMGDPRGLPVVLTHTHARSKRLKQAATLALMGFDDERAKTRLQEMVQSEDPKDMTAVLWTLAKTPPPWFSDVLVDMRQDKTSRALAEDVLRQVDNARLQQILDDEKAERQRLAAAHAERERQKTEDEKAAEEERKRLAAERERREEERNALFVKYGNRTGVAASAGLAGLYGGAAAASHAASFVSPGVVTETLYTAWGGFIGAASSATLSWFLLSDVELTTEDVGMTTMGSAVGAWMGGWTPSLILGNDLDEPRLVAYSAALGHLAGLTGTAVAASYLDPSWGQLAEVGAFIIASNTAAAGTLMSLPIDETEMRLTSGVVLGATALGAGAGIAAAAFGDAYTSHDYIHMGAAGLSGGGIGLLAGAAARSFGGAPDLQGGFGGGLLGVSAGVMAGMGLAAADLTPGVGGSMYETYATYMGGAFGLGVGMMAELLPDVPGIPDGFMTLGLGASAGLMGAASTALVPDGVALDVGDLLLQPLIMAMALYQTAGLGLAANADPLLTFGASLAVPAALSLTLTHTAPLMSPSLGDVMMIAYMAAVTTTATALAMASIALRAGDNIEPWMWVAATGVGLDVGVLAGIGLDFLPVDRLGWKVTYVSAVTAASTLVLLFPMAILVPMTDGLVQLPDLALASAAMGLAVGLGTVWLIDFSIVPDLGLDEHIPIDLPENLKVQPSFAPVPTPDGTGVTTVVGLSGTF